MIVYNVKRSWFTLKAEADQYRRAEGLPPSATFKLTVSDRDDLAALLNGLCGLPQPEDTAPAVAPVEVLERNRVGNDVPDFIPKFLLKDYRRD